MTLINTTSRFAFYRISRSRGTVTARYGRIGTSGRIKLTTFNQAARASAYVERKVTEKLNRGYVRVTA